MLSAAEAGRRSQERMEDLIAGPRIAAKTAPRVRRERLGLVLETVTAVPAVALIAGIAIKLLS